MKSNPSTPSILYKYRDFQNRYNKRTLFNFEIYLPSTSMFNDPYEGSIPFEYHPDDLTEENLYIKMRFLAKESNPSWTDTQVDEYCYEAKQKGLLNDPKHIEKMRIENINKIDSYFGILSLTPKHLNYLMWSHYANSHRGFCIGFDTSSLFDLIGAMGPVVYEKEIPKMRLFGDTHEFYVKQLSTKSNVWCYEEEYRLVQSNAAKKTIVYNKEIIKRIILGCKMPQNEKFEILEFVKSNKVECEISELSLDLSEFKLNEMRIY